MKELEKSGHLVERYTYWKEKGTQNFCVMVNVGQISSMKRICH